MPHPALKASASAWKTAANPAASAALPFRRDCFASASEDGPVPSQLSDEDGGSLMLEALNHRYADRHAVKEDNVTNRISTLSSAVIVIGASSTNSPAPAPRASAASPPQCRPASGSRRPLGSFRPPGPRPAALAGRASGHGSGLPRCERRPRVRVIGCASGRDRSGAGCRGIGNTASVGSESVTA